MKTVIILRGVSGCGKNTYASLLVNNLAGATTACICCADDYFTKNGEYKFDAKLLGDAHKQCMEKFINALSSDINLIIVANTNTKYQDYKFYLRRAEQYGYMTFVLVVENYHGGVNSHNVPDNTLQKQAFNISESLKLR